MVSVDIRVKKKPKCGFFCVLFFAAPKYIYNIYESGMTYAVCAYLQMLIYVQHNIYTHTRTRYKHTACIKQFIHCYIVHADNDK